MDITLFTVNSRKIDSLFLQNARVAREAGAVELIFSSHYEGDAVAVHDKRAFLPPKFDPISSLKRL